VCLFSSTNCVCQVIIGNPDLKANHNITQIVEVIAEYDKYPRLRDLLKEVMTQQGAKVLIFCETKRGCDDITRSLRNDGWPALALHGDKSQKERDWVLAEFKSNRHPLMLATDVAARGLGRRLDACCMLLYVEVLVAHVLALVVLCMLLLDAWTYAA
jgi:superfamily II DNA/RNA helicase